MIQPRRSPWIPSSYSHDVHRASFSPVSRGSHRASCYSISLVRRLARSSPSALGSRSLSALMNPVWWGTGHCHGTEEWGRDIRNGRRLSWWVSLIYWWRYRMYDMCLMKTDLKQPGKERQRKKERKKKGKSYMKWRHYKNRDNVVEEP